MSDEAVIEAEYVEWRMVKTRSSLQLIFEVPLERQEQVMRALGVPLPNVSTPVAIARLVPAAERSNVVQIEDHRPPEDMPLDDDPHKPPRPLSQIAGILCNSGAFQCFIQEGSDGWDHRPTTDEAAEWLRANCGIKSRAELNTNAEAIRRFKRIRAEYEAWRLVA
jgi:hypothetical protein